MTASAIIPGRVLKNEVEAVDVLPCRASRARDVGAGAAEMSRGTIRAADSLMVGVRFAPPVSSAINGNGTSAVMTASPRIRVKRGNDRTPVTLIEVPLDQRRTR